MKNLVYLDTNVFIWVSSGLLEKISNEIKIKLDNSKCLISPMVMIESQLLYEIKRISWKPEQLFAEIKTYIDIEICNLTFEDVMYQAFTVNWTRDPFDRLIVAQAKVGNLPLITADRLILKQYKEAIF